VPLEKLQSGSARALNGICAAVVFGHSKFEYILHKSFSFLVQRYLCPKAGSILMSQNMLIQTNHIFQNVFSFIHLFIHIIFFLFAIDFDTHEVLAILLLSDLNTARRHVTVHACIAVCGLQGNQFMHLGIVFINE
jgi:hypothetical protein